MRMSSARPPRLPVYPIRTQVTNPLRGKISSIVRLVLDGVRHGLTGRVTHIFPSSDLKQKSGLRYRADVLLVVYGS